MKLLMDAWMSSKIKYMYLGVGVIWVVRPGTRQTIAVYTLARFVIQWRVCLGSFVQNESGAGLLAFARAQNVAVVVPSCNLTLNIYPEKQWKRKCKSFERAVSVQAKWPWAHPPVCQVWGIFVYNSWPIELTSESRFPAVATKGAFPNQAVLIFIFEGE